jgi:NRPS condensation-like uncharacterized protein
MLDDNTPIPLTLFEKYFLFDTTKDFPMHCDGVLHFTGTLHRERFVQAVEKCLKSQPLFARKIVKRKGQYYWTAVDSAACNVVRFIDSPIDINSDEWDAPIDLFQRNGLELSVFTCENKIKIYYRMPHLCTDASGFWRFLNDVFAVYEGNQNCLPQDRQVIPERIFDRDKFPPVELPAPTTSFQLLGSTVKEVIKWLLEKPFSLTGSSRFLQSRTKKKFFRKTFCISSETLTKIRQFTHRNGYKLNDILLTAFYNILPKYSSKTGNSCRIMLPVNMRWKGSETIPASNIISYVFLSRTRKECSAATSQNGGNELLQFVHDAIKFIKDWHIGFMFLDGVKFFNRIPFGLRLMTRNKKCLAAIVFSNIGSVEKFFHEQIFSGSTLTLTHIDNFAPIRYLINLSVVGSIQNGNLIFNCLINTEFFTESDLDNLFQDYEAALEQIVNAIT